MNLVVRDQNKDRCATMIPELAMQLMHRIWRDLLHLLEVNEGRIFATEYSVQI
jgi:hypothetical protein